VAANSPAYQRCRSFRDCWEASGNVFPAATHRSVDKASGETSHMARWTNTLRQANARSGRKTLAFSKSDFYHELVTRLFIIRYNLRQACEV
jgi:IS1 family transposase